MTAVLPTTVTKQFQSEKPMKQFGIKALKLDSKLNIGLKSRTYL
jgi:hypothetical protein